MTDLLSITGALRKLCYTSLPITQLIVSVLNMSYAVMKLITYTSSGLHNQITTIKCFN